MGSDPGLLVGQKIATVKGVRVHVLYSVLQLLSREYYTACESRGVQDVSERVVHRKMCAIGENLFVFS
jgi:hypothetical protein